MSPSTPLCGVFGAGLSPVSGHQQVATTVEDSSKTAKSCVPLDRSPAGLALALVLGLMVVIVAVVKATAAEPVAVASPGCETLSIGGPMTAGDGDAVALADITICYRPLPSEFGAAPAPMLRAETDKGPTGAGDRI
jgi:hypothetical protein